MLTRLGINKQVIERVVYFFMLLVFLVFVIHILACIWAYIGIITYQSWVDGYPFMNPPIKRTEITIIYVKSMYFIITTLTTVGYGDIVGATNNEHIY